jgi:integrase
MTGVYPIHQRKCATKAKVDGKGKCNCRPTWQAWVPPRRPGEKPLRKNFATKTEAKNWRADVGPAVKAGTMVAPTKRTVADAGEALMAEMRDGTLMSRSGEEYKPATVRRYEEALRLHIGPELGHVRLSDVKRAHVKEMWKNWLRAGMAPSSIRNNLDPLKVIIREAIDNDDLAVDPIAKMKLPAGGGRRERVADRAEAESLIDALPESEQALWATGLYAGLRRGELRALRCSDLHFDAGEIGVRQGWDDVEGAQDPKSDAGERRVPMVGILKRYLRAHLLATGRRGSDLVFGRTAALPFTASTVGRRAMKGWGWKQAPNPALEQDPEATPKMVWVKAREDAMTPLTLHEGRHSTASYLVAAGANDLELAAVIGHSDPRTTKSIYTHLFPDSRAKVGAQLDSYLEAAGE